MNHYFYRNLKMSHPVVVEARGVWLTDSQGKTYMDSASGAVCANIGHGVREINEAICKQLERVACVHSSQLVSEPGLELTCRLIELAPANFKQRGRVYLTSGGSESVETAVNMARSYSIERGEPGRPLSIAVRDPCRNV